MPEADPVHKVTIIPRGRALGVTSYLPIDEKHTYSKEYLEAIITYALGGRAAEKLVFDHYTTGAGNDIEKATSIARKMVCEWGMSEKMGPMSYGAKEEEIFLGREIQKPRDYSEKTAQEIGNELDVAYLLEGTFQKYGESVKMIVQLIRSLDGGHVWSNMYEREWKDIFNVQSEVAQTIAQELYAEITPEEKKGFVMGVYAATGGMGVIICAIIASILVNFHNGWVFLFVINPIMAIISLFAFVYSLKGVEFKKALFGM